LDDRATSFGSLSSLIINPIIIRFPRRILRHTDASTNLLNHREGRGKDSTAAGRAQFFFLMSYSAMHKIRRFSGSFPEVDALAHFILWSRGDNVRTHDRRHAHKRERPVNSPQTPYNVRIGGRAQGLPLGPFVVPQGGKGKRVRGETARQEDRDRGRQ